MAKPVPPPALTPAPLPSLVLVPGVTAPGDQTGLRCPNCNRIVLVAVAYVQANPGGTCSCPLCGRACSLPE